MIGKGDDCLSPLYIPVNGRRHLFLRCRCGRCINCRQARTKEWCLRLQCESKYWGDKITFLTLTYNDEHLPYNVVDPRIFLSDEEINANEKEFSYLYYPTLRSSDLRNFLKRLRKRIKCKIKYYAVGEYGTLRHRPHYHIMIFGLPFTTEVETIISECWSYGFIKFKPAYPETCYYVAGYIQKKLYGDFTNSLLKLPEFMRCSQGLGKRWLLDNLSNFDEMHPFINVGGIKYPIPRYFRKYLVEIGKFPKYDMVDSVVVQHDEYLALCKDLNSKGVSLEDFFRNRRELATKKFASRNALRNKTGEI